MTRASGAQPIGEPGDAVSVSASPCDRWLAAAPHLPSLSAPASRTAERLMLLLHYGIDWSESNWVSVRRGEYWDNVLPSRVRAATYVSADLHQWWTRTATVLGSTPRTEAQRVEVAALLTADPRPVLAVLRDSTTAMVLRTRIAADAVRASTRPTSTTT